MPGETHDWRRQGSDTSDFLYMATVSAIRAKPVSRTFYTRLVDRGNPKKIVLIAARHKLLTLQHGDEGPDPLADTAPNYARDLTVDTVAIRVVGGLCSVPGPAWGTAKRGLCRPPADAEPCT